MAAKRGFSQNGKSYYTNVTMPQEVSCNFIVDSTNGNGLGIRSPKSNGYIESIFMHTTQTPGVVNGVTNPNPVAGYAQITFKNNFNYYLGGFSGQIVPTVSNSTASTTANNVYVITSLGTATLAQWQAAGVPVGQVPAVGLAFVPTATGTIGGSAAVQPIATTMSNIDHIEVLGDPNLSLDPNGPSTNQKGQMILVCSKGDAVTAPTDGTVIGLTFYLSNAGKNFE